MKLIIFTTCKPFIDDDAWRQEQAIKSWTLLEGIEKKIIIIGNDQGTKEICDKYNLIHEHTVRNLQGVPYLHAMFEVANKYADDDDIMLWTNSDMIYFQDMITAILNFKQQKPNEKNYLLVGQRIDWHNPKWLEKISKDDFFNKINLKNIRTTNIEKCDSLYNECSIHLPCGIDYVIHSKSTFINNIDKNLVIAGTRHDMIMVGIGLINNYFCCDITNVCPVIHQNHGYQGINKIKNIDMLKKNNNRCMGVQKSISDVKNKMIINNNLIKIITQK